MREIEDVLRATATAAACQLHAKVMDATDDGAIESEVKGDGSRVTPIDLVVEQTMVGMLTAGSSLIGEHVAVVGEEGSVIGDYDGMNYAIFFDPTDGTALVRLLAPGSTTGCCLYDKFGRQFMAAAVADPWLQRLFFTRDGVTYRQRFSLTNGTLLGVPVSCRVSEKSFADGGELLVEVAHGFERKVFGGGERQVLTQGRISKFWSNAHTRLDTKVRMCSSNLMHQLLVASGGDAIATIMTAIGGPWDMSGVALVEGAGGVVRYVTNDLGGFGVTSNPMKADLVICANTSDTADQVYGVLESLRY